MTTPITAVRPATVRCDAYDRPFQKSRVVDDARDGV